MTRVPKGPAAVAADYARQARRFLARLAEPGIFAERSENGIRLVREKGGVALPAGEAPAGILADLVSSGAVRCVLRGGQSRFLITDAGLKRVQREADAGDAPFADQHRTMRETTIAEGGEARTVRLNLREDPLHVLRRASRGEGAGLAGPAAIEAGDRLARELQLARALPSVTANWSRLVVDGVGQGQGYGLSPTEAMVEARRRVDVAMRAVGPDFASILMDVCGFAKGVEELERERGLPVRSGKVVLGSGLITRS